MAALTSADLEVTTPIADSSELLEGVRASGYFEDYLYKLRADLQAINVQLDGLVINFADLNITNITVTGTTFTVDAEDVILVDDDAAGALVTITMPAASAGERRYSVKKLGSTAPVQIDATDLIDGTVSITLTGQYESVDLYSNSSTWNIL